MPVRHTHRLHHLAVAIALTLGYAGISLAQQSAVDPDPQPAPTPAQLISALDAFIKNPDTLKTTVKSGHKATDGISLQLTDANDLVIVKPRGSFAGLVDGGGGDNVLQLDAKQGKLGESRHFSALEVKQGVWARQGSGDFSTGVLIRAKTSLVNEGHILGGALTEGILINKGQIDRGVTVLPGGDLTHSGFIGGNVNVLENGHFSGSGTVGDLNVQGRFSVDEVYGAPRVRGDLNLAPSALLAYSLDASGHSPTIVVDGTAHLGDATLKLVTSGDYPNSSQHTLLEAGHVEGRFGHIENDLAYMTPTLDYSDARRVGLTYARNDERIEAAATSANARAVGESIEEPSALPAPVLSEAQQAGAPASAPSHMPAAQPHTAQAHPAPAAPTAPTAAAAASAPRNAAVAALLTSNKATAAIALEQLAGGSNANLAKATLSSVTPVSASLLAAMQQLDGSGLTAQRNTTRHAAGDSADARVWLQALGHGGKLDRDAQPLQHSTKGLLLGADWRVGEEWRLGLMGGTSSTRMDSRELDGALDSWHLGAYALRQNGPMSLRLGATWSNHDGSSKRDVAFARFSDRLKGNYDASTQQAFAELGYNLGRDNVRIEPFVSLGYQRYQRDGYSEKGGAAALKVDDQTRGNLNRVIGVRMASVSTLDNGMRLSPRFSAGWKHVYGNTDNHTRQRLVSGGRDYTVHGAQLDRNSLTLDTGLDLGLSAHHTLGIGLTGEIGSDSRNHGVTGQWRMAF
ncbi:autotransporter outer membrane beta-barrel domain-containing protein [Pseudomonas sp. efr-133-TYG-5]|uniref:autotransporter outer membrane beta-barrel domain-containing protein n=1 Tax=Pseudomonas sp. efr-133-TYG-5 TaxID=3040310 RepID=UPI00255643C5|nr:autotransporter outer membrane beta-barrel domain-containing protein [Pseudomonas sp. efr-133-TYG-5]